ncbi:ABC transporter permease [Angustibacter luteus]|uniref:ABC transporter permease n=1 Tax=Angustibacter luteus TaxID=658456 RepID=A0ABW1JK23_9ACTN
MSAVAHGGATTSVAPGAGGPPPDAAAEKTGRRWTPYLLLLPGMLWLAIFFAVPMVFLASTSLQTGSLEQGYVLTFHFQTYVDALQSYWPQFLRSFGYAATATIAGALIGYPLAYAIAFKSGKWKNFLLVLVIAPFFTSFLIRTLAWQTILSNSSPVVKFFQVTGLMDVLQFLGLTSNDQLMASKFAVIAGLTYNFLPFMVLPLYASLERLDPRLLEAAGDLYASPFTGFRKITFPLSLPGLVAGTLLTFIPAAGDYINSKLLGSTNTTMIGQVIDGQFLRVLDYPTAAALSFVLMLSIVLLVSIYVRRAGTEELV